MIESGKKIYLPLKKIYKSLKRPFVVTNNETAEIIKYAKSKGILETIINTNATMLDDNKSKELISAGLDFIIYSFDGGDKKTYEKMRIGRFKKNSFKEKEFSKKY